MASGGGYRVGLMTSEEHWLKMSDDPPSLYDWISKREFKFGLERTLWWAEMQKTLFCGGRDTEN